MDERGQVLPLVAVVVMVAGLACVAIGRLGQAAVSRAQAVTAADAAALAGVAAGAPAARAAAASNGARLVGFEQKGPDARAEVRVDDAGATARARRGGDDEEEDRAPALRAALARAAQLLGRPVPTVPAPALGRGEPVNPRRRAGLAVEIPDAFVATLAPVARRAGLCQPYPRSVPGLFQLCGA